MASDSLSIGDLARATATKVEAIRYYERIGLLPSPPRTGGNYRAYGPHHLGRLSFIRRARDLGFSIEQVKTLLDLADQRERSCVAVDALARGHLAAVERKLADLSALRRELTALLKQCRHGTVAECRIIEALAPPPSHPDLTRYATVHSGTECCAMNWLLVKARIEELFLAAELGADADGVYSRRVPMLVPFGWVMS